MSKVSVTGSRRVMGHVIEAIHELNLVHLSEYRGEFEGFDQGTPTEGAESASERLVTIRSLESILDIDAADAGPTRIVDEEELEASLPEIRETVNSLDDRRSELRDQLRAIDDEIDAVEPFVSLGLDLDLLTGYDSLEVAVGEGDPAAVRDALARTDDIRAYEVFSGDGIAAAFVYPSAGAATVLDDALVGVEFNRLPIPDASGDPETHLEDLEHERATVESKLDSVATELEEVRVEHGAFLLAAEETLSIEVQKAEAPLQFATTKRAFVAEGWIPSDRYADLMDAVRDAVGDRVDVEELERAAYTPTHGHETETVADGGTMGEDQPPTIQDNPRSASPFELLVEVINRPRYWEVDPTIILLLTFPAFFGFMIGDVGYGLLYTAAGYWLWNSFDSDAFQSLGGIAIWSGAFTVLFGILYGEVFGTHIITTYVWEGALGLAGPPMEKGLHAGSFARLWLTLSVLVGILHLGVGWVLGFVNDARVHGTKAAFLENGSWLLILVSIWLWIFSEQAMGSKPAFLVGEDSVFNAHPIPLGFEALPALVLVDIPLGPVGTLPLSLWLAGVFLGLALAIVGEWSHFGPAALLVGVLESLTNGLVNVISYTRIAIVLLAKAGMAFVVNLLVFGAYEETHGAETIVHFTYSGHVPAGAEPLFGGLIHMGVVGILGGIVVLLAGHLVVLLLGVTSAGLQAVRLEYVEFFGKFYEGGGAKYDPFGYRRTYTTED